jgi:hypothetical protein
VPQNPQAISRYPLSPGEEERLRDEIVRRLIAMRCGMRNPVPRGHSFHGKADRIPVIADSR